VKMPRYITVINDPRYSPLTGFVLGFVMTMAILGISGIFHGIPMKHSMTNFVNLFLSFDAGSILGLLGIFFYQRIAYLEKEKKQSVKRTENEDIAGKALLLQKLIDTIPSPIFYKGVNGRYLGCNDCFAEKIFNLPKEEIIGKTVFEFPGIISSEQAKVYKAADDDVFAHPQHIQQYDFEAPYKASNEIRQYTFYKAAYFNENGEVAGLVGVMLDITELKKATLIDSLTGLYNQKFFLEQLEHEIDAAKRDKHPLSLVIIDIDRFKRYNDTHNHVAGDKLLEFLGKMLKDNLRSTDSACRVGGEEFSLILAFTALEGAVKKGEELRQYIESETLRLSKKGILKGQVTISAGVVQYNPKQDVLSFREAAEIKLYSAKKAGRNCVKY